MNKFDQTGLEILKTLLPDCTFNKNGNVLLVTQNNITITCEADFDGLYNLIDNDVYLRQIDSTEFYWGELAKLIKQEIKDNEND